MAGPSQRSRFGEAVLVAFLVAQVFDGVDEILEMFTCCSEKAVLPTRRLPVLGN